MKKLIFAVIAGVTAMSAAQAQTPSGYIGLGVATSDHAFNAGAGTTSDPEGYKASAKIFGGVNLSPTWAVEAGYTDIRKADHSFTVAGVPGTATTDGSRSYIAGKATKAITDKFDVYGKLGVGYSKVKLSSATLGSDSDSKTEAYGALGAQYNINEKVALTAEYERYGKKKDFGVKADAFTVGAKYNF
jgi:opacity protein-like surface antigen